MTTRSPITTHVLDVSVGRPASGVVVHLAKKKGAEFETLGVGVTDEDGRATRLLAPDAVLEVGTYRLTFDVGAYYDERHEPTFYPRVEVTFAVGAPAEHYHVPLLLSPFGYSTYRGS